jgi:putative endonuclease
MSPAPLKFHYVYVMKSGRDGKLYLGSTNDLKKRYLEHTNGKVHSTKYRLPVELVYYEAYRDEKLARRRESRLKSFGKGYQELKKRIIEKRGAG